MPAPQAIPDDPNHWTRLLQAAARLQEEISDTFIGGGTAAALWAGHRVSHDVDHLSPSLAVRFDTVLAHLESLPGWSTAYTRKPDVILGSLDGIETGLIQIRDYAPNRPLETAEITTPDGLVLRVPTYGETLRIKSYLLMIRNMARDYVDHYFLSSQLNDPDLYEALSSLDQQYSLKPDGPWTHTGTEKPLSFLQEMAIRLGNPAPKDHRKMRLYWDRFRPLYSDHEAFPSWEEIVAGCQLESRRVHDVVQVLYTPDFNADLTRRYLPGKD